MHKKIIGNPTTTPYPRPDWNQTDETKADFIKNKPVIRAPYPYNAVDSASLFRLLDLYPNTVTLVYGKGTESGAFGFNLNSDDSDNIVQEIVLILDMSEIETASSVQFSSAYSIKWINGEPPEIEVGKVYMFSFVLANQEEMYKRYWLAIGGEFY